MQRRTPLSSDSRLNPVRLPLAMCVVLCSPVIALPQTRFREPDPLDFNDRAGYVSIFDGATLRNWVGDPAVWRVEDGALVGESTSGKHSGNSYISYHGATAKDFDFKPDIKIENISRTVTHYHIQISIALQ